MSETGSNANGMAGGNAAGAASAAPETNIADNAPGDENSAASGTDSGQQGGSDEPLGEGGMRALNAEREAHKTAKAHAKDLQAQLDAANKTLDDARKEGLPEWQQQINQLQTKLDREIGARKDAEAAAAEAAVAQLRSDRAAAKGLPAALAKKLTATKADDLDAEIDELLPLLGGSGPSPNPQQGNPSRARGGSLAAGRERYAAQQKS